MDEQRLKHLALAFRQGDAAAFRVMVEALSRTLMALAYRYTRDWEWARDLTQETWIRVHDRIGSYDPSRSFVSWLHAVHRHGCLDFLRRGWVRRESPGDPAELTGLAGAAPDDPDAELERRELHERICAALLELSETQREVLVRVDLEQGDQQTVAREMGIRYGTLRTTLHFARRRLAAVLRERSVNPGGTG